MYVNAMSLGITIGSLAIPTITKRPCSPSKDNACLRTGVTPAKSKATFKPRCFLISRSSGAKAKSAPRAKALARASSRGSIAITLLHPTIFNNCTAWIPKPPTPKTTAVSPACTLPVDEIAAHGVDTASGIIAACSKGNESGILATRSAFVTTYSAQPPS